MVSTKRSLVRRGVRGAVLGTVLLALLGTLGGCFLFRARTLPAPDNVSATEGTYPDQILVTWESVDGATSYEVQRATGENAPYTTIGETTETTFYDTDVSEGIVYWYRVRALAGGEYGPHSAHASGYLDEDPLDAPAAPTGVSATRGTYADKVVVGWNAVDGAADYEVYRRPDGEEAFTYRATTGATSYDDSAVEAGKIYYYRVRACAAAACSGLSASVLGFAGVTPGDDEPPTSPRVLTATDGDHSDKIRVEWTASLGATYYEVWRADDNSEPGVGDYDRLGETTGTTYDDVHQATANPLGACTLYWYRVRACNAAGCSAIDADNVRVASGYRGKDMTEVSAPSGLQASYRTYDNRIQVNWNAVDGAVRYVLEFDDGSGWEDIYEGSSTSYAHEYDSVAEVPEAEADYDYRVRACGDVGCGCTSSAMPVTGRRSGRPAAPSLQPIESEEVNTTALFAVVPLDEDPVQTHTVTLTWEWTWEPAESPNPVESFAIYRRIDGQTGYMRHDEGDAETDFTADPAYTVAALDYEPADPDDDPVEVTFTFEWKETVTVTAQTQYEYYVKAERGELGDDAFRDSDPRSVTLSGP